MRFAAIFCSGLLIITATASAHGPGDHSGGGHPNLAGGTSGGNGLKPAKFEGGPGDKLKASHNADGDGKSNKPDFAGLHPNAAHVLKAAAGNAAAGNNATPFINNLTGQGGAPLLAHHAGELLGFLEMAKNSSDPQVAARATQILQQFKQLAQQHGNLTQGGSTGTSGTTANGSLTNGFMPVSTPHAEGAHAAAHTGSHPTH